MLTENKSEKSLGWKSCLTAFKFKESGILGILILICIALSIASPSFLQYQNLINVVRQFAEISIMAIGMTFVIVCGEIDLSVGSIYGICAVLAGYLLHRGYSPLLVFIISLLVGVLCGSINGLLTTKARMPAFIATLGTMQLLRGGAYALTNGWPISQFPNTNNWFFKMGDNLFNVIPIQVIIMIIANIILGLVLAKTVFGFKVYSVGGNSNASKLAGINISKVKIVSFILAGVLSAFAGMMGLSYLGSVSATAGSGREMDVIAAVIIGGASLSGGTGTIFGTFLGAAIMGVVRNGMILLGIPAFYQDSFIGIVILVAVLANIWLNKKSE